MQEKVRTRVRAPPHTTPGRRLPPPRRQRYNTCSCDEQEPEDAEQEDPPRHTGNLTVFGKRVRVSGYIDTLTRALCPIGLVPSLLPYLILIDSPKIGQWMG